MKEAIACFERAGGKAKHDLMFAAVLITMKFRPDEKDTAAIVKEFLEKEEWLKMMPKKS